MGSQPAGGNPRSREDDEEADFIEEAMDILSFTETGPNSTCLTVDPDARNAVKKIWMKKDGMDAD